MNKSVTSKSSLPNSQLLPVLVRRELDDDVWRTTLWWWPLPVRRTLLWDSDAEWSPPAFDLWDPCVSFCRVSGFDGAALWAGAGVWLDEAFCSPELSTSLHSTFGISGLLKLTWRIVSRFVFLETWWGSSSTTVFLKVCWESVSESSVSFKLLWLP